MSSFELSGLAAVALLLILALGIPVAYAIGIVAAAGLYFSVGPTFLFATLETLPYSLASQYTFLVVPMFVLMGGICARIGVISDLYNAAYRFTSAMKGGLFMSTILSSAAFAAISGSTVVAASVFSRIALPEMKRYGYKVGVAAGCIAAAGTLSAMIPPSLVMVLFGILTNESIGALLLAGLIPGVMTAVVYAVGVRILLVFYPNWAPAPAQPFSWAEKFSSLKPVVFVIALAALVLGGIYSGAFSPSSAGAVGAAGAVLIGLLRRKLKAGDMADALREAAITSTALFMIIIAGLLFSRFLISTGLVTELSALLVQLDISKAQFIAIVVIIYLVLGLFVDGVSVLVITLPFLYPIAMNLGVNPIWLGVLVVKLIEIAAITPPVGLNLFAVLGALKGQVRTGELFRGVIPFIFLELLTLAALLAYPQIATWLPDAMLDR